MNNFWFSRIKFFIKDITFGVIVVLFLSFMQALINLNFPGWRCWSPPPRTSAHEAYTDSTISRFNGVLFMNVMMKLNLLTSHRRLLSLQYGYILCLRYRGLFTKINFQGKLYSLFEWQKLSMRMTIVSHKFHYFPN